MLGFIKRIFIWWHDNTLGHSFTMWKRGARLVGEDVQGNRYYEESKPGSFSGGGKRRWVVYHGHADGSRVTPEWNGWLHHTFDEPPTLENLPVKKFEKPYLPNMTGTPMAYHPKGSLSHSAEKGKVAEPYEAWSPENA
ncbi:NADH:ubiquinone oxidoreductase subunit NDUFA12 [Parvularcula sp. LCG005]|uniref:NADH:ubiquinone oxidoreductase subunit NDUFA12 n=1 Tax=Parvularcula sp. LCG005 TaxID=3078805 RepID=UPI00294295D2|nr:NADH:ubiquinone oxidoreductase subunit NDUFA12 [Parvularcula sp. LCG005]WOI54583.1 NADH:ubiquinone oxidoreductase subunit NDUFA12 [Parvularcula sp. LCG005]